MSSISGDDHSVGNNTDGYARDELNFMYTAVGDNNINCWMGLMPLGDALYIILEQGHGGEIIVLTRQPLHLSRHRHIMHTWIMSTSIV